MDVSDWLSNAQRITLNVIDLFNQQFYVPFPIKDTNVPQAIDKVADPVFDSRFLSMSPLERYWPGLTTQTACTTASP